MTDVLAVLKEGMNTEVWGMRFYTECVERTEDANGKKVFQTLISDEGRHLDILRGQYAAISGDKGPVSMDQALAMATSVEPTDIFPEADDAECLVPADMTDAQALRMAMDFERRGYDMYAKAAEDAVSDEEKSMWEFLAEAENRHYVFLEETLSYLVNDGTWYFDDLEHPFFEG